MAQAGLQRPNCYFLGLKWISNNVEKSKNLYLIGRKMSKMSKMSKKNDFFGHLINESYLMKTKILLIWSKL